MFSGKWVSFPQKEGFRGFGPLGIYSVLPPHLGPTPLYFVRSTSFFHSQESINFISELLLYNSKYLIIMYLTNNATIPSSHDEEENFGEQ
jgi:hypothetical protein